MAKFSAIMEGATIYLKKRDRKLTEKFLSLAVKDTFVPVLHGHLYQVSGIDNVEETDWSVQVTVPWVIGMTVFIAVVFLCARDDSPCCNICAADNK